MKRSISVVLSLVLMMLLTLSGCMEGKQQTQQEKGTEVGKNQTVANGEPKIIRTVSFGEPGSLHPAKAQGTHESWPMNHMFEGLIKKVEGGKLEPGMAKEWSASDDGLKYKFILKDGMKWSNGDPVTTYDFEYAWKLVLNPETASEYAYQLYAIKGAEAYNTTKEKDPAKLKELEDAVGVKATDEKTLEVTLEKPTPYFPELVAFYTYYPIDKKVNEQNPDWPNEAATFVSNGPFKIAEWKHKEVIKLVKNENYYDKDKIKLDGITFYLLEERNTAWQMYRSNEIDLDIDLPTEVLGQLRSENNPELKIPTELATYFYRFNTTKKPFNNAKVRQALSMAIDRQTLVDHVTQGGQKPAYAFVPNGLLDADGKDFRENAGNYFAEDAAKAKELLAQGLQEEGMKQMPATVILYNTSEAHKAVAEAIQEMWRKNLEIETTLENVEFKVLIDRYHKLDYDIARSGWIGDFADPMTFIDMFTSWSTQNDTGWTNPQYDELTKSAQTTNDQSIRMKAMHDAEKILMDEHPVTPLYFYTRPMVTKPNVKGIIPMVDRYPYLMYADIEK